MSFRFKRITGGDITMADLSTVVTRYRSEGAPEPLPSQDFFDYVASHALDPTVIPKTYSLPIGTLYLSSLQIHENYYAREYEVSATYTRDKREVGAYQITVDQTGGTVHVTTGTRISGHGNAADAVDNGGLIGVDGDKVQGVDIPIEQTKISVNFRHPGGVLTASYIRAIGTLVGRPNSDTFLGYAAGEVLYLGGQFSETNTEATAQYNFAISPNRTNFTVGGITISQKYGWDVISPTYKHDIDNNHPVRQLQYIEIVRPAGRDWVAYASTFGWGS